MDSLGNNPDRKFIYVEQAYWALWWAEQDADSRALAQQYVSEGRISFINGGWCMVSRLEPRESRETAHARCSRSTTKPQRRMST